MTSELIVHIDGDSWREPLDPQGTYLGRSPNPGAHIVLRDDRRVISRRHAMLYRNPVGQWILRDLGSSNGTVVAGERVSGRSVVISHGTEMRIGDYRMSIRDDSEVQHQLVAETTQFFDSNSESVVLGDPESDRRIPHEWLCQLNRLTDRLSAAAGMDEACDMTCRFLADELAGSAAILQVADGANIPDGVNTISAACPGGREGDGSRLIVSRRVVEAVCEQRRPALANDVELTVSDQQGARTVCCAMIEEAPARQLLLYLEVPIRQGQEILDYVQAVSSQANFAIRCIRFAEARKRQEALSQQLEMARTIQMQLIPRDLDICPEVKISLTFEPAMWVGGDYCDVLPLDGGRKLAFALGDVMGKGLPAALIMTHLHATLRSVLQFCHDPTEVMDSINRHLCHDTPDSMFVTLFLGVLEPASGELTYVNAGHLLPLLVTRGQPVQTLGSPRNMALGLFKSPFQAETFVLERDTTFVAFTDGVSEAPSARNPRDFFGEGRLQEVLEQTENSDPAELLRRIRYHIGQFQGDRPQADDLTMLALSRS